MTTVDPVSVAANVAKVRGRIDASGGEMVKLIAVTKSFGAEAMVAAFDAGCDGVGENYAQELVAKFAEVPAEKRLAVHFIGRLQTNKIKLLKNCVDVWQSVDRAELIGEIAKRCNDSEVDRRAKIMLQVNTTNEADKGGCEVAEIENLLRLAVERRLQVVGLMTVGPTDASAEQARPGFRLLRKIADDLGLEHCSMGMTADLEVAVEEGATMIRVGSALFGQRS